MLEKPGAAGLERHFCSSSRTVLLAVPSSWDKLRNVYQIVGDDVEQEVRSDAANAAMLGFSKRAMLLAPAENALDHGQRDCDFA